MAENTNIEWADHTFNPWIGCTKVSPACDHCYAERTAKRMQVTWGAGAARKRTTPSNWAQPLRWNRQAAERGVRYRVFCASLADVFDNEVPAGWRSDLFALIRDTPHLDWLLLTKRIGNAFTMLPCDFSPDTFPNVWLGATVVNQTEADRDIPKLLTINASVRFLSIEPMLGPIELCRVGCPPDRNDLDQIAWKFDALSTGSSVEFYNDGYWCDGDGPERSTAIDWVIAGGESGPQARPSHPFWFRALRDQCVDAGVPFLFKQWGEWTTRGGHLTGGGTNFAAIDPKCERWPDIVRIAECGCNARFLDCDCGQSGEEVFMQRVGKKTAGRMLDGRTWDEVPA